MRYLRRGSISRKAAFAGQKRAATAARRESRVTLNREIKSIKI